MVIILILGMSCIFSEKVRLLKELLKNRFEGLLIRIFSNKSNKTSLPQESNEIELLNLQTLQPVNNQNQNKSSPGQTRPEIRKLDSLEENNMNHIKVDN